MFSFIVKHPKSVFFKHISTLKSKVLLIWLKYIIVRPVTEIQFYYCKITRSWMFKIHFHINKNSFLLIGKLQHYSTSRKDLDCWNIITWVILHKEAILHSVISNMKNIVKNCCSFVCVYCHNCVPFKINLSRLFIYYIFFK